TPWNLPFHASAGGIHSSNLISESEGGRATASMRQNAGSAISWRVPGTTNGPAGIAVAERMLTAGIVSAARFSQGVPFEASVAAQKVGATASTSAATMRRIMSASVQPHIIGPSQTVAASFADGAASLRRRCCFLRRRCCFLTLTVLLASLTVPGPSLTVLIDRNHDLAFDLPVGHQGQGFCRALERARGRDVRPEVAFGKPAAQLADALGEAIGFAPRELAPEHADNRTAFQQREIQRDSRDI